MFIIVGIYRLRVRSTNSATSAKAMREEDGRVSEWRIWERYHARTIVDIVALFSLTPAVV